MFDEIGRENIERSDGAGEGDRPDQSKLGDRAPGDSICPAGLDTSSGSVTDSADLLTTSDSHSKSIIAAERRGAGPLADISNRTNEIQDAIDVLDERIAETHKILASVTTDSAASSTTDSTRELHSERLAHLALARKFLFNILNQIDTFEEDKLELRVNQLRAISKLISFLSDSDTERLLGFFRQPTGAGKTVLFGVIARLLNVKTLILVPRINLVEQTKDEFIDVVGMKPDTIGTVTQGSHETSPQFVIATYQSHVAKMKNDEAYQKMVAECELILCDEAHRAMGDQTYNSIEEAARGAESTSENGPEPVLSEDEQLAQETVLASVSTINKTAAILAFTATPQMAGKSVESYFKTCIASEKYSDMIAAGVCVPFRLHRVDGTVIDVDLEGNFTELVEARLLEREGTYQKLVLEYAKAIAVYKGTRHSSQYPLRGVAFCVNIAECDKFAEVARQHGLRCEVITGREAKGKSGNEVVKAAEDALLRGDLDLIVTVKKLAEGWDCKPVNAAIWARACTSPADVVQGIGRTGRAYKDPAYGRKEISHIFETRWSLKTTEGSRRGAGCNQPLGIVDALVQNGEDPTLVCVNDVHSELDTIKPRIASGRIRYYVETIFKECLDNGAFSETLRSLQRLSRLSSDVSDGRTLYKVIKERVELSDIYEASSVSWLERLIVTRRWNVSEKDIGAIKEHLFDLIGKEILKRRVNEELVTLVLVGDSSIADRAYEQLVAQNANSRDLCRIACSSAEHATRSWYLLIRQLPPAKYLLEVMLSNPNLRLRAWNELKKRELLTVEDVRSLLRSGKKAYSSTPTILVEAQRYLLDRTTDNNDLAAIVEAPKSEELGLIAATKLIEQDPDAHALWLILERHPSLETRVLSELTSFKNRYLQSIILRYPNPWRLAAAETLRQEQPTDEELLTIVQHVPEMAEEEGQRLMQRKLSSEILVELVLSSQLLRQQAAEKLFARKTFSGKVRRRICTVIETLPDIAPQAARALLDHKVERETSSLLCIINNVESLRDEAQRRLEGAT